MSALKVQIGAELRELENALSSVSRKVSDVGKNLESMGKTLSTRVTAPIVAFAGVAVRAFGQQEDAERKLRAALQANGRQVESLFNRYNQFASEMQRTTIIGDETTLAMLQQAESLGLTADSAERAVKNSIAMQSAFGVNAESAIRYTAALEQGNATMLTRYIPTLRDIEDESERVAEAQRVLANAFNVAESEAQGSRGQLIQLKNSVGDLLEVIGEVVAQAIQPFVKWLKNMAESLQNTDRETIALGVAIAGLVAGIGPALFIIGKLTVAIGFLVSPIGLVIAALAALAAAVLYVWDNWQAITERISDIGWWRNTIIDMIQFLNDWNPFSLLIDGYNALIERIGGTPIPNPFGLVNEELDKLRVETKEYEHEFGSFGDAIVSAMDRAKGAISGLFGAGAGDQMATETEEPMERVAFAYESASDRARAALNRMVEAGRFAAVKVPSAMQGMANEVSEIGQALQTTITSAAISFAESFGQMIASAGQGQSFFNSLLGIMADFASQLGRIVTGIGVAMLALQPGNLFSNPWTAIAAGAALVALGSALRSTIQSGPGGSSGSSGGQSFEPFARDVQAGGNVTFEIQYDKLVGVLDNGDRRRGRIG